MPILGRLTFDIEEWRANYCQPSLHIEPGNNTPSQDYDGRGLGLMSCVFGQRQFLLLPPTHPEPINNTHVRNERGQKHSTP